MEEDKEKIPTEEFQKKYVVRPEDRVEIDCAFKSDTIGRESFAKKIKFSTTEMEEWDEGFETFGREAFTKSRLLNAVEMEKLDQAIKNFKTTENFAKANCVIVAIMSHGTDGLIFGRLSEIEICILFNEILWKKKIPACFI